MEYDGADRPASEVERVEEGVSATIRDARVAPAACIATVRRADDVPSVVANTVNLDTEVVPERERGPH